MLKRLAIRSCSALLDGYKCINDTGNIRYIHVYFLMHGIVIGHVCLSVHVIQTSVPTLLKINECFQCLQCR